MHADRPSDPSAEHDGDADRSEMIRQMVERSSRSPREIREAMEDEESKAHGRQLARERGEAVPAADDEEGRE